MIKIHILVHGHSGRMDKYVDKFSFPLVGLCNAVLRPSSWRDSHSIWRENADDFIKRFKCSKNISIRREYISFGVSRNARCASQDGCQLERTNLTRTWLGQASANERELGIFTEKFGWFRVGSFLH